jgi:septum formation topological specificity factor MinE
MFDVNAEKILAVIRKFIRGADALSVENFIFSLKERNSSLESELASLRLDLFKCQQKHVEYEKAMEEIMSKKAERNQYEKCRVDGNVFYRHKGEDGRFLYCQVCFENDDLRIAVHNSGESTHFCPNCKLKC